MSAPEGQVPGLRMSAYYYSFDSTGVRQIDLVLSAVACAGKACHHTGDWHDDCRPYSETVGANPVEWIQNAAKAAADSHASLTTANERLVAALEAVWRWRMHGTRGDAMPEPIADIVRAALSAARDAGGGK